MVRTWLPILSCLVLVLQGCPAGGDPADDDTTTGDDDLSDDDAGDDDTGDDDSGDDDAGSGEVVDPEETLIGARYALDLGTAEITQPPQVGSVFPMFTGDFFVVLEVEELDQAAGTIHLDFEGNELPAPEGIWYNPSFTSGAMDAVDPLTGCASFRDAHVAGVFSASGTTVFGASLVGELDTRGLDELIDPAAEEGAACELLTTLGMTCDPCSVDAEPFCFDLMAQQITGERLP